MNGNLLTSEILKEKNPLTPKIRRARTPSHIPLFLPPKSIGFFVLPGARTPVCIDKEIETKLLLEEIEEDQNGILPEDLGLTLGPRSLFGRNRMLEAITQHLKEEMSSDEKYYNKPILAARSESAKEKKVQAKEEKAMERGRKFFIDRARLSQKQRKQLDLEKRREELQKFLMNRNKSRKTDEMKLESKTNNMEFSSKEIESILKERAKARAAERNIVFTDEELDAIMQKASFKFVKKVKRSVSKNRARKDINMPFLERLVNLLDESDNRPKNEYDDFRSDLRSVRRPREVNMQMLQYKDRLERMRTRMENRRDRRAHV